MREMPKAESLRIHIDWWCKCMTCAFWHGKRLARGLAEAPCEQPQSPLFKQVVTDQGNCPKWSSFDEGIAYEVLEVCYALPPGPQHDELERRRRAYEARGE